MDLTLNTYMLYEFIFFVMVFFSAFFSGAETAIVSAGRIRLEASLKKGKKGSKRAIFILDNIEDAISMVLVGNNIANIAATAFLTFVATKAFFFSETELLILTTVQTILFLIFCEISPKIIAKSKAESFLIFFSMPIKSLIIITRPIIRIFLSITVVFQKILRIKKVNQSIIRNRDELDMLFKLGEKEGLIDEDHQVYVSEILTFREVTAYEVMIPTIDIDAIELNESIKSVVELIEKKRFSRIPVYDARVDNIIGHVFYRDILKNIKVKKISDILHKPHYVPATKKVADLYVEMLDNKLPVVFVVNEYGAVIGMLTHEDIAEEVVGEIQSGDHHDEELITKISDRKYLLNGSLDVHYFERYFSLEIEKKGFETIAGFITYLTGRIPTQGEKIKYGKMTFTIEEVTDRAIEKIILSIPSKKAKEQK